MELWSPSYVNVLPACWQTFDRYTPERIGLVCDGALPGLGTKPDAALRYEVRPGESTRTGAYSGSRAEASARKPDKPPTAGIDTVPPEAWPDPIGSVRYYEWDVLIPEDFTFTTLASRWFTLTQWKGLNPAYGPPLAIEIKKGNFRLGGRRFASTYSDLGPVTPGTWTKFLVGIGWSPDPTLGWVSVERDRTQLIAPIMVDTMDLINGVVDPVYLKQGIYRSSTWPMTQVIYQGVPTITDQHPSD